MSGEITTDPTKKRLEEIEKELAVLSGRYNSLKSQWDEEKYYIQQLRDYKAQIEDTKIKADEFERQGNLAKVAELRYGAIHNYENKIKEINDKLNEIQQSGKMLKEEIDDEDVAEVVAKWTRIPITKMLESERAKLLKMEDRLHQRIIGQDEAVSAVSNAIRRSRAGLQDPNRPVGSFIFIGTTGVGKTEMARSLAEYLFDDEASMIRIDMSEYMEKFAVSRLIGAPPGYVGYEEGGQLTEAARQKPYSVVLLDEIEKAHPDVFNVLLQVLDDGRLTDSKGRIVNFKNTIIIMTSNLGTEILQDRIRELKNNRNEDVFASVRMEIIELLRRTMRPEFLNRIDDIILFKPLSVNEIHKIALLQIDKLSEKLKAQGLELELTDEALDWIAKIGYDENYGARPLKRAIQKHIADPLALKLLASEYVSGDTIVIDSDNRGGFDFKKA